MECLTSNWGIIPKILNLVQRKPTTRILFRNNKLVLIRSNTELSWSYAGVISSLMHAITGNRKIGYNVAAWNCRRGLLNPDGSSSTKITDRVVRGKGANF
jgi:hypothetical protein